MTVQDVDYDNIIEEFEQLWQNNAPPHFSHFLERTNAISHPELALELAQVDLERRWRSPGNAEKTTADFYCASQRPV